MGSTPISPTINPLVFDTSPLQALHRVRLLPVVRASFSQVLVPGAVFDETMASVPQAALGRVPDLADFPWIEVVAMETQELLAAGAEHIKNRRGTEVYRWRGRQIDRPELEAVLLGLRLQASIAIEDAKGVRCATDAGGRVISVAGMLQQFEREGRVSDAGTVAQGILETGYWSRELQALKWRNAPR